MKILVTGGSGFIGTNLLKVLKDQEVRVLTRNKNIEFQFETQCADILDFDSLKNAFDGIDTVIHCAGIAHIPNTSSDIDDLYISTNVQGTRNIAKVSATAGVKRIIFISSVNVYGENTNNRPLKFDDQTNPTDITGISKLAAEAAIKEICVDYGIEYIIIRSPLVYGPGVKGNFAGLIKLTMLRLPLPFASVCNMRSLVSVQNLVDLIVKCIDHPNAANEIFLVSDDDDVSTPGLLTRLGCAANKPIRLVSFPAGLLILIAKFLGNESAVNRFIGTLQVDISHTKDILNWAPSLTLNEGLKSCFQSKDE